MSSAQALLGVARASISSEAEVPLPGSLGVGRIQFLVAVGLRASAPRGPTASCHVALPHGRVMQESISLSFSRLLRQGLREYNVLVVLHPTPLLYFIGWKQVTVPLYSRRGTYTRM